MKLEHIYKADINRDINGVIKVAQNDEKSIKQELGEYIITKELRKHFNTFFTNYEKALSVPTDKIGVWISGFFGKTKSIGTGDPFSITQYTAGEFAFFGYGVESV